MPNKYMKNVNILCQRENVNWNYMEIPSHPSQNETIIKKTNNSNAGQDVGEWESLL